MLCFWSFICQINASVLSKHSITFVVWIFPSTVFDRGIQQPEEKTGIRGHDLLKKSGCRSPFTLPSLKCSDCILHWFVVLETSLMAEISSETESNSREHFLYSLCKNSLLAFYNRFFFNFFFSSFFFLMYGSVMSQVLWKSDFFFFLFYPDTEIDHWLFLLKKNISLVCLQNAVYCLVNITKVTFTEIGMQR